MKPSFKITDGSNDRREPIKNDTVYQTIALIFEKITFTDHLASVKIPWVLSIPGQKMAKNRP